MATPRFAWGIDIGNRALKAVKLISTSDGLRIDDFEVIEHETVLSTAGDNRESLIQTALANFVQRHPGIEKGQVGVGVSGQQSFARFIKLPPVEDRKIPEIVRFEAIQQIPFPLDDVEWSYQLFRDEESPDVEVGIFAMRKELVNQHIKFFTDIDLNVQVVQMNPLSVYNAMYYDSRIKGTTMIVDLGAENTDLIIAEGETIWLRSIPIGGNNFTEALTKAFKVNFVKAEDLKRNANSSKYGRQIMQAMRPIFADLVSEIQRSIGFYASVHRDSRITKVIALGSTFRLPGLQKYLQQNLQLEVEKISSLSAGSPADAKMAVTFDENILSTVGAYGLALQVMGQGKITSSLLPEHIRREKMWREKTKWFGATAALFLLAASVPYGAYYFNNWNYQQAEGKRSEIQTVSIKATDLDRRWAEIEQAGGPDRQRITNVNSLESYRSLWPNLLTDIYMTLPQAAPNAPKGLAGMDAQAIKAIPRSSRQEIIVERMVSKYYADLTGVLGDANFASHANDQVSADVEAPASFGGGGGGGFQPQPMMFQGPGGAPGFMGPGGGQQFMGGGSTDDSGNGNPTGVPAAPTAQRGFLITVKCVTPNANAYNLVDQTFVKNLLAVRGDTPDKPYAITKAVIVSSSKLKDDQPRMQKMQADYTAKKARDAAAAAAAAASTPTPGGPGGPFPPGYNPGNPGMFNLGVPGAPAAAGNATPDEAFFDPVLGEDVRNDTECTILFAVLIDPPPPPATQPAAAK
jgi:type IV pilus assembly protein PilM